jgi:hypothetical protein
VLAAPAPVPDPPRAVVLLSDPIVMATPAPNPVPSADPFPLEVAAPAPAPFADTVPFKISPFPSPSPIADPLPLEDADPPPTPLVEPDETTTGMTTTVEVELAAVVELSAALELSAEPEPVVFTKGMPPQIVTLNPLVELSTGHDALVLLPVVLQIGLIGITFPLPFPLPLGGLLPLPPLVMTMGIKVELSQVVFNVEFPINMGTDPEPLRVWLKPRVTFTIGGYIISWHEAAHQH